MIRKFIAPVLLGCMSLLPASAADVNSIVAEMVRAQTENRTKQRAYVVTRQYRLVEADEQKIKTEVLANVSFLPPDRKHYSIESSTGGMGEKVVRKILDSETQRETTATKNDFIPANYDFVYTREENWNGRRYHVLRITPKREEKDLLDGEMWVDAATYNVWQVKGSPAKKPSWWVKHVAITIQFADVSGMWLQTRMEAAADIRFKGKYVMTANDLNYRTSQQVAQTSKRPAGAVSTAVTTAAIQR